MPTIKKASIGSETYTNDGKQDIEGDTGEGKSNDESNPGQEESGIGRLNRSAFSESDLRQRFDQGADNETASNYAALTRSESNLVKPNVRLQIPSRESHASGGSGLQIVPAFGDLVSEDSFSPFGNEDKAISLADKAKKGGDDQGKDHIREGAVNFKNSHIKILYTDPLYDCFLKF